MSNSMTGRDFKNLINDVIGKEVGFAKWFGEDVWIGAEHGDKRLFRCCSFCGELRMVDEFCSNCGKRMKNVSER